MPKAKVLRAQWTWEWEATCLWLGETASNSLHFDVRDVGDQPDVTAGSVDLAEWDWSNAGGTLNVTTASGSFLCERGWKNDSGGDTDGFFSDFLNAWSTFYAATKGYMAGHLKLRDIRLYPIGADGRFDDTGTPFIARPTAPISPPASDDKSPDTAIVFSLYSQLRTRRGRGRYYFGPIGQNIEQTAHGTIGSTTTTALATAMAAWMTALRDVEFSVVIGGGQTITPVILHRSTPLTTASVISQVRVGDEFDVQERRTKNRPEVYSDVAVT